MTTEPEPSVISVEPPADSTDAAAELELVEGGASEQRVKEEDGFFIDEATGEILGSVEKPQFAIDDLDKLTWALGKLRQAQFMIANLSEHYHVAHAQLNEQIEALPEVKALRALQEDTLGRLDKMLRPHGRTVAFFMKHIESGGREVAKAALEGKKERTLNTLNGSITFRKTPAKVEIADMDAAISFCKALSRGDAIKQAVQVGAIKKDVIEKLERAKELFAKRDDPVMLDVAERARIQYLADKRIDTELSTEENAEFEELQERNLNPQPVGITPREATELQWIEDNLKAAFRVDPPGENMYVDVGLD